MTIYFLRYWDEDDDGQPFTEAREFFSSEVRANEALAELLKKNTADSDFYCEKEVYSLEAHTPQELIDGLNSINYEYGRKNLLMAKSTSNEEKRDRIEKMLYDLQRAIEGNFTFAFGPKITAYKVNWSAQALGIRTIMSDHDFIEIKGSMRNQYAWTAKAKDMEIPHMAEILTNLIEKKMSLLSDIRAEVREVAVPLLQECAEQAIEVDQPEDTQELDEIEWGVIRFALRKMVEKKETYHQIAKTILEKV